MNQELYKLVRSGAQYDENGERLDLSNKQMAEIKFEAAKQRYKKRPQLIQDLVIVRHKLKVTPFGCSVFDVVRSAEAVILCDKKPHEWERYKLAAAPIGVETSEAPAPKTRVKKADNGDV